MYKESMYNHGLSQNGSTILYNHLSGVIAKLPSETLTQIQQSIKGDSEPTPAPVFEHLLKDGFIVRQECDEAAAGELKYHDAIYGNTLDVTVLASEQCNFRCKYCYEDFKRGNIKEEVIRSFIRYLKKHLHNYNKLSIDWFGGEPLIAPKEIEAISTQAIELCRKMGKPFAASMTTNGYLLSREMFARMLECRVLNYQITIDGLADTHNVTRPLANGGPSFEHIIANLREIRDHEKSRLFKITIRSNLSKLQLPRLDEYIAFLSSEFGQDRRFEFFFRPVGNWGGERVQAMEKDLLASFDELYSKLLKNSTVLNADAYIPLLKQSTCNAASRNSFVLGSDGTVYKCTMLFNEEYNILGRLSEKGMLEIDQNKLARWLSIPANPSEQCGSCDQWQLCRNHTCPAKAFKGDRKGKTDCGYERKSIDYVLALLDKGQSAFIKHYK